MFEELAGGHRILFVHQSEQYHEKTPRGPGSANLTGVFSSRLEWDLHPNAVARLLEEKRKAGVSLLDLTESNPTKADIQYADAAILHALADPRSLVYDPRPAGLEEARHAVAACAGVEPERILLTASTSEAYAYLFKLLADPGDEILVPRPSYPLFEYLAALECVRIRHYPLVYQEGWWLDLDALKAAVNDRTRAVVVVNPNNPTGSFLKRDELERLAALCAGRNLAIISDEVFADYAFGPDPKRVVTLAGVESALTFSLSGLSKLAGLPQMKLGWIVISGPCELRARARERLELIADTFLSVGTPVQHAATRLLALRPAFQKRMMRRLRQNLEFLKRVVWSHPACRLLDVEGGWYAILKLPRTRSEEEWVLAFLGEDDVLVEPGFFYDFQAEAFAVVSLLTQPEVFQEGLRRLLARAASA
jgi:alanine-synthesizing transaminase